MPKSANSVANTQAAFVFFHSLSDFTVEAGIGKYFGEVRKITVLYHVFFHKFTAVGKKIFFFAVPHDAFFTALSLSSPEETPNTGSIAEAPKNDLSNFKAERYSAVE